MREIKFRAWDKVFNLMWDKNSFTSGKTSVLFDWIERNKDPKGIILMQYTGLKDKNGKEIYEGDICGSEAVYSDNFQYEIRYGDGKYYISNENGVQDDLIREVIRMYKLEIIGNIYENPELIKT